MVVGACIGIGYSALVLRHGADGIIYCFNRSRANCRLPQRIPELNYCCDVRAAKQAPGSRHWQQNLIRAEVSSA